MAISRAAVITESGEQYTQRLSKHWSHRFPISNEGGQTGIDFGEGQLVRLKSEASVLLIEIHDDQGGRLDRLEEVVAAHIERFAHKETLEFPWRRAEGATLS